MEQHPVPQDIKSFQFRLVGDMTLRQFAFLAGGAALAYASFVLPFPTYVKYPFVVIFAGGGAAAAFVPINGRPLDRWLIAFLQAIFGPTRRIWMKSPEPLEFFTQSYAATTATALPASSTEDRQRLEEYLASLPPQPESAVDKDEQSRLKKIDFTIGGSSSSSSSENTPKTADESRPSLAALTAPKKALQVRDISGQEKVLPQLTGVRVRKLGFSRPRGEINLSPAQPAIPDLSAVGQSQTPPPTAGEPKELFATQKEMTRKVQEEVAKEVKLESYQAEVKRLAAEKEILEEKIKEERQKAEELRRQAAQRQSKPQPKTKPSPPAPKPAPPSLPSQPLKKLVLPTITNTPNVINGVVADRRGNLLENAVVVIKDDDGTPVRALKTNKLGQFAISTPLRNGVYQIEVEKEGYSFEPIYQDVSGSVLPPLQIRSQE